MNFQPMLAATVKDVSKLQFPLIATPKLDGIRCVTLGAEFVGQGCAPVCRSLKRVPNNSIREIMSMACIPGLDGELMTRGQDGRLHKFNTIQGAVMRHSGEPRFEFHVFDYLPVFKDARFAKGVMTRYWERLNMLAGLTLPTFCLIVPYQTLRNAQELDEYEEQCIEQGYEGVMLRSPHSPYKFGRSTFQEHWLLKLKRFEDSEAEIIGTDERMSNQSPKKDNALGLMRRHAFKDNMVPTNSLGSLQVRDLKSGVEFSIGSGFNETQRMNMWDGRDTLIGKIVKYKHQPHGQKDKPRMPIFLGFRDAVDIS